MNVAAPQAPSYKKTGEEVYFQGNKKNEINDLKNYLRSIVNNPQFVKYRKQAIKKIIVYTTQGFDTSKIYPQMVLASATKDIVQKKLIFFYLSNYSSNNPDFARMAINTFMKDTNSSNPNVRSLAIRHLSNLRFKGREQYVMPILRQGLKDFSSEVKRSCVMGIAKVLAQSQRKQQIPTRDEEILNIFYGMLRDPDPYVICCVLEAINEIEPQGIGMSKKLTLHLISNLNQYTQMQLPIILKYVELYEPKTIEEAYEILSIIQPKLKSPMLSVVISISKIFLKYANKNKTIFPNILEPIKSAIMSFTNSDTHEIQYVALKHVQYLIDFYKIDTFVTQYKKFFIQNTEPTYLQLLKINLLAKNCRITNLGDILNQLCEYMTEQSISRQAVDCLETLLLGFPQAQSRLIFKSVLKHLQSTTKDFLCNNCLPLIRNYLRRYPQDINMLRNVFYDFVSNTTSDEARIALIEIIGDYGDQIQDAKELLSWKNTEMSDEVKICLIRANIKVFFARPSLMVNAVSSMFKSIFNDDSINAYVRDYAAFIYRALESNPEQFKKSFINKSNTTKYLKPETQELEFNTLQISYRKPASLWILDPKKHLCIEDEIEYQQQAQPQMQQKKSAQIFINLDSKYNILQADDFNIEFELSPEQYEQCWQNYQIGSSITRILKSISQITEDTLEELFRIWHISTIASAEDNQSIKLYLYAKLNSGQIACMEFQLMKQAETMTLLIKSQNQELGGFISKYIQDFLKLNQIL